MKEYVKQNGFSKFLVFSIIMAIPVVAILAYVAFLINWNIEGGLKLANVMLLLILAWIFLTVQNDDFFGPNRSGRLQAKHGVMLAAFPLFVAETLEGKLFFLFLFYATLSGFDKSNYWQYEIPKEKFSKDEFLSAIKKEFYLVKLEETEHTFKASGYGLWTMKISIETLPESIRLRVEPMHSGYTFLFPFKVSPGGFGEIYGRRVLKHLGIS